MSTSARAVRTVFTEICGEFFPNGPMWASAPTNISEIRFGRTESSAPTKIYNRTQKRKYSAPPANAQVACCFHGRMLCHLPAWQLVPMGALSPRRRRCSSALQKVYRVLAAAFFEGVLLWLAVQSDPLPAPLFAHFFWQDRKSGSPKAQLQCNCQNGSPVKPDKRTARGPAANSRRQFSITCPPVTGIA